MRTQLLDLYTVSAAGGAPVLLSALQDPAPSISYSGDGRRIYIATAHGLSAADLRSGAVRALRDGEVAGAAQWTP